MLIQLCVVKKRGRSSIQLQQKVFMFTKMLFFLKKKIDAHDIYKYPQIYQNPLNICLANIYTDMRRIKNNLLTNTTDIYFLKKKDGYL